MTRAELKAEAKEQIRGKVGLFFVMTLIVFGISLACGFVPFIGSIASLVIAPAFSLSLCMFFLKLTKGEETSVGDVFAGFTITGRALWLNILISVFSFLWSLLLIIPGIIKGYAYSMAFYVLADNPELTASEALAKSQTIMRGHKMELFILELSFIGWFFVIGLTFGLAAIYVAPYMHATIANFYNSIKEA